jgi:hypothetical protein
MIGARRSRAGAPLDDGAVREKLLKSLWV